MKGVLRLMLTYFTGTMLLRAITVIGVLAGVGGSALYLSLPPLLGGQGGPSRFSLAQESFFFLLPVAGVLCFAFAASLLPALFARLAASHYLYVLPHGRGKLLASAFATIGLIALFAAGVITMYYYRTPLSLGLVFQRALAVSLVTCSFLYVVLWLTGRSGSGIGLLAGALVTIATLVLPLRFIAWPSSSLAVPWIVCAVLWAAFAAFFLLAPRLTTPLGRLRHALAGLAGSAYRGGGEIDFLIGTARPWMLAAGQAVPVVIASYFLRGFTVMAPSASSPWLFFLTIVSVVSGAVASLAATRSRALWLRARWTRSELFAHVEGSLWRHQSYALGVLLLLLVGVGSSVGVPTRVLAFGMVLVALGTALSTYLGLMVTARIGWTDALLAVATMLALMAGALYTSAPTTGKATIVALEAALVALALMFRALAQRRWSLLDWMLCRAEPGVRASA
jgi:hypothetical protein